jgi:hypothetical protein
MREFEADYAGLENQHVQMIVLDTLVSRVSVVTEPGANPGKSVRDRMPFASLTSHGPLSKNNLCLQCVAFFDLIQSSSF